MRVDTKLNSFIIEFMKEICMQTELRNYKRREDEQINITIVITK